MNLFPGSPPNSLLTVVTNDGLHVVKRDLCADAGSCANRECWQLGTGEACALLVEIKLLSEMCYSQARDLGL